MVHLQPKHQTKNYDDFSHSPNFDHSEVGPLSWNGPAVVRGYHKYHEEEHIKRRDLQTYF